MSRYEIDHEAADKAETNLVAQHVAALTDAVKAGDSAAVRLIDNAMQDWTPEDWTALTTQSAAGVNFMQDFITKTIQAKAEELVAAHVVAEIRNRPVPSRFFGSAITRRRADEAWDQFQAGHLEFS
jgi:hypothetical protein